MKCVVMAKASKTGGAARTGGYKVAGSLPDGVTVLEPKNKPTHFTSRQIRDTITKVLRDAGPGRFISRRRSSPKG